MIIRIIVEGVQARREKERAQVPAARQKVPKKELVDLFAESPFKGLEMNFERFPDALPRVDFC